MLYNSCYELEGSEGLEPEAISVLNQKFCCEVLAPDYFQEQKRR